MLRAKGIVMNTRSSPVTAESQRIMYVCSECADNNPEGCGHYDRNDLRVLPDGRWLCEGCFEETTLADRGTIPDDAEGFDSRGWNDLPPPRAYVAQEGT
jgi:hypothetical protein